MVAAGILGPCRLRREWRLRHCPGVNAPAPLPLTLLALPGGFASTVAVAADVLRLAGVAWQRLHGLPPRPLFSLRLVAPVTPLPCLGGLALPAEPLAAGEGAAVVFVASGGVEAAALEELGGTAAWLAAQHGAFIAASCSGAWVAAAAGVLDGRRATTHWALAEGFRARFPHVDWRPRELLVEDGPTATAGGVAVAQDLALRLVARFGGAEEARRLADALLLPAPRRRQPSFPPLRPLGDAAVAAALARLGAAAGAALPLEALARDLGLSLRSLQRRVQAATGRSLTAWRQSLRIAQARELLESGGVTVAEAAAAAGYDDLAFFRSLFRREVGESPARWRERFLRP